MATRKTGKTAAKKASAVMRNKSTAPKSKSAAGSALAQRGTTKKTTAKTAKKASAALRDGRSGKATKSAAGSALSQRKGKK